jgi:hypothetical protein
MNTVVRMYDDRGALLGGTTGEDIKVALLKATALVDALAYHGYTAVRVDIMPEYDPTFDENSEVDPYAG